VEIKGKTFLVTGGGSGLGEAAARALAAAGANVIVADMNEETGGAVAADIGRAAVFAPCDVTDETQVRQAIQTGLDRFSALHGVVHCAGVGMIQKVLSQSGPGSLDVFAAVIKINLIGTFNVTRLVADAVSKQEPTETGERGVIINTASIAAYEGQIGQAAYAASKGGVVSMTLPIARELARHAIRIVTIAPGVFETPMMAMLPDPARQALSAQVPFPSRFGQPPEFAALAVHIIQNQMINGTTIRLDGALRMGPK
jgi:NAD(P)-dependent dehydrogenase (short-subunit alcohol dehydrogenase family)